MTTNKISLSRKAKDWNEMASDYGTPVDHFKKMIQDADYFAQNPNLPFFDGTYFYPKHQDFIHKKLGSPFESFEPTNYKGVPEHVVNHLLLKISHEAEHKVIQKICWCERFIQKIAKILGVGSRQIN